MSRCSGAAMTAEAEAGVAAPSALGRKRLFVEVAGPCVRSCPACAGRSVHVPVARDLRDRRAEVLQEAAAVGFGDVTFCGANLLMLPEATEMIGGAIRAGLRVRVHGWCDMHRAHDLIALAGDVGPVEITVPVWGPPRIHDAAAGRPGAFDADVAVLRVLAGSEGRVRPMAAIVMTEENAASVAGLEAFFRAESVPSRTVTWWFPLQSGGPRSGLLSARRRTDLLRRAAAEPGRRRTRRAGDRVCNAAVTKAYLDQDLGVRACPASQRAVADCRTASFADVWRDDGLWGRWRTITLAELPECLGCELVGACHVCPAPLIDGEGEVPCPL